MQSREKPSGFREGTHTHTGGEQGEGLVGLYIYMLYTYMLSTHYYTYKVVSMQLVHVLLKSGTYPRKEGSARKRERMICGDKHKRKISLVHRGRTRA